MLGCSFILLLLARLLPKKNFREPTRRKAETFGEVRVLGTAAKKLGAQSVFLCASCYQGLVGQQPWEENLWGAYHLHGKPGNSSWKIKWYASFHLEYSTSEIMGFCSK